MCRSQHPDTVHNYRYQPCCTRMYHIISTLL
jgi:hypothetical protein